ncbi:MAG: DUF1461 domain-containing protein [Alcanivoracaceae bacterium]|nr:DUF1461 domain-containing protein [Alcanivoracaceae bacterium]
MTNWKGSVQAKNAITWVVYVLAALWLAISLSCWVYARFDYGYGFWYDTLEIGTHIKKYAPKHPNKRYFSKLSKAQHTQAFHEIRVSVHNSGQGLAQIQYAAQGRPSERLLDQAEVQHLEDVARLISACWWVFWGALVIWGVLAWRLARRELPPWRWRSAVVAAVIGIIGGFLIVVGPKKLFYIFHVWIFPAEHQWFFYWEQSLMSTLMKAPDLFGGIAAVLVGVGVPLAVLIYLFGLYVMRTLRARIV